MRRALAATALAGLAALGGASASHAQAPCDSYSGGCPAPGDDLNGDVKGGTRVKGVKRTLPFTGAEITLLALAGTGTVAAGTALVVAGRRRHRPAA